MLCERLVLEPRIWAKIIGCATVIGLECGLIGPFGSYPANPFTRTAYWVGLFWIGGLIIWPSLAAGVTLGSRRGFPVIFSGIVALLFACLPIAVIAALGCRLFWPLHASGISPLEFYELTLLIAGPTTAIIVWVVGFGRPAQSSQALNESKPNERNSPLPQAIASAAELPDHLRETAICLQMEDHHVRIHSQGSSTLYLMPMEHAIRSIGEHRGIRVHRSWWVDRRAVVGFSSEGRSASLMLANGLKVPIARNRLAAVRARGFIDGISSV